MSVKSILCSVFGVLLFWGLLIVTIVLFTINIVLGVIGVIVLATVPAALLRTAVVSANGLISKLIAKVIAPLAAAIGFGIILLTFFLGYMPF